MVLGVAFLEARQQVSLWTHQTGPSVHPLSGLFYNIGVDAVLVGPLNKFMSGGIAEVGYIDG